VQLVGFYYKNVSRCTVIRMSNLQVVLFESDTRVFNPRGIVYVDGGFRRINGEET